MPRAVLPAERSVATQRTLPVTSDRVLGVALMAIAPALFWALLAMGVAPLLGIELSAATVLRIGAGIALFLGIVATAVTSRTS